MTKISRIEIICCETDFLQNTSQAWSLVIQTIQYYGISKTFSDKKWGHLFRWDTFRNTFFFIFIDLIFHARFTYETDDFNHFDLIQELELDPEFFKAPPPA